MSLAKPLDGYTVQCLRHNHSSLDGYAFDCLRHNHGIVLVFLVIFSILKAYTDKKTSKEVILKYSFVKGNTSSNVIDVLGITI